MAQHLKQAEQHLMLATEVDRTDPLKAAELYVTAIKHLRQANFEQRDSAAERKNMLLREATERFEDCERRIKQQKEATKPGGAPASVSSAPARQGPAPAKPSGSGGKSSSWFSTPKLFGGSSSTESEPANKSQPSAASASVSQAGGGARPGVAVSRAPAPARAPPPPPARSASGGGGGGGGGAGAGAGDTKEMMEKLKGVDKELAKMVLDDIVSRTPGVSFEAIAGLEGVKKALQLYYRAPPKGILLFGPPGTGKTLLAKAVATESNCKFFSLSASSLTSKWVGQAEKLVKALFAVAEALEPSVLFIDEVDSVLSARSSNEHDAMRRLKTEFLVQFDGELDEAVRRRFTKRLFVPLPEKETRVQLISHLIQGQHSSLSHAHYQRVADLTQGYSGSDLAAVCKEAAMAPIRDLGSKIQTVSAAQVRAITVQDLISAVNATRPSVDKQQLKELQLWNSQFGSSAT